MFNKEQIEQIQSIMMDVFNDARKDEHVFTEGKYIKECILEIVRKDLSKG